MIFEKGHPKVGGKQKGYRKPYSRETIEAAFEKAKIAHGGVSLLEHLCELAYEDEDVAIKMLRKLVPDLKSIEITDSDNPEDFAERVSEQLAEMELATTGIDVREIMAFLNKLQVGMVIDEALMANVKKLTSEGESK